MKNKNLITFALVAIALVGCSTPQMKGTWRSSLKLTQEFNLKNAILEQKTTEFLNQIIGHTTIKYKKDTFTISDSDREIIVEGGPSSWDGINQTWQYNILAQNEQKIVMEATDPTERLHIITLHFINEDTYWVYLGSTKEFEHLNIREYFARVE